MPETTPLAKAVATVVVQVAVKSVALTVAVGTVIYLATEREWLGFGIGIVWVASMFYTAWRQITEDAVNVLVIADKERHHVKENGA